MGLVTLIFDLLTSKLVCETHLRWRTFLPNLGTLGLCVLSYSLCTRGTDRRTDKSNPYWPLPYVPLYVGKGYVVVYNHTQHKKTQRTKPYETKPALV